VIRYQVDEIAAHLRFLAPEVLRAAMSADADAVGVAQLVVEIDGEIAGGAGILEFGSLDELRVERAGILNQQPVPHFVLVNGIVDGAPVRPERILDSRRTSPASPA